MTDINLDIEKALAMASGQSMDDFYNNLISESDKQLLRDAIENIFQGLSIILWTKGGDLRSAWTRTLDNMRDEFFTTSRRDIVTIFLQHAIFDHRKKWLEKISDNNDCYRTLSMLGLNASQISELLNHAEFQKQQGYNIIKQIFEKYDSGFKPETKVVKPVENTVNMERENTRQERERTK